MNLQEAQEALASVDKKIQEQGRIVDARLLDKQRQLQMLVKELRSIDMVKFPKELIAHTKAILDYNWKEEFWHLCEEAESHGFTIETLEEYTNQREAIELAMESHIFFNLYWLADAYGLVEMMEAV